MSIAYLMFRPSSASLISNLLLMHQSYSYTFSNQLTASVIQVNTVGELPHALEQLGLSKAKPVLVLVGGASGISTADQQRLKSLFHEQLAPTLQQIGAVVVDGGTDAGIMSLMGQARTAIKGTFPLVGVAAIGTLALPEQISAADAAPLEPNHTHFLLVPGDCWGDESPWLAQVASLLADKCSSVTMVVNGGEITWLDITHSIAVGRPVITLAGSGRVADILAASLQGKQADPRAQELITRGKIQAVNLGEHGNILTQILKKVLLH